MEAAKRINPALRRALTLFPDSPVGIASHFLYALEDWAPCPYVLHARVSSLSQGYRKNLPPQIEVIRAEASERKFALIGVTEEEGPGWRSGLKFDRYKLERSIAMAREHGGIVLFESTDRAIRPYGYNSRVDPGQQPTKFEYELLMELADGVPLVTVYEPDLDWREVRSKQSRRGQAGKDALGGRPAKVRPGDKKRRHQQLKPQAKIMHEAGMTRPAIAAALNLSEYTLRNWIRGWRK